MRHLSLAAALLVAGCAAMPPPAPIPLEGLPGTFSVSGRVSVTQPGHGEIVRLHWSHATATDVWTVATPMGVEVARIERDSEGLVVLTADGRLQARIADPRHKLPKTYWV